MKPLSLLSSLHREKLNRLSLLHPWKKRVQCWGRSQDKSNPQITHFFIHPVTAAHP